MDKDQAMTLADQIDALAEKATKGEWELGTDTRGIEVATVHCVPTQPTEDGKGQKWVYIHHPRIIEDEWYFPTDEQRLASAELIVLLQNNIPAITEALRKEAQHDEAMRDRDRLREEVARLKRPEWFYHPDETERCAFDVSEVVEAYDLSPGTHVIEVTCARPLPSIWCAVHVLSDAEKDALETDEPWLMTEHDTEAAAKAALETRT